MTIKEAEGRTGLARANIRYYEEQGFFSPARGENGYRDYSQADVDILLKVKLLRQLGFPLEEIRALQRGEQSLAAALARREAGLEGERRALDQAARLCRDMREDGADFSSLDARHYLDRLAQTEEVLDRDRDPVRIFPWRRYFARTLDVLLCNTVIMVLLQLTVRANFVRIQNGNGRFLLDVAAVVLMMGAETLFLSLTGTTPGKALLGLRLLREDGSRLSLEQAGQRAVYVGLFYGFSQELAASRVLLLTIAGGAMLLWAWRQVKQEKSLPWEEEGQVYLDGSTREQSFWEREGRWLRVAGYLAATAACVGLMVGGHLLAARPPHRSQVLTAEEFVDNYNQYMAFHYGEENLSRRLTLSGQFEEVPQGNSVTLDLMDLMGNADLPGPSLFFVQGNPNGHGGLRQVILTQKHDSESNGEYFISIPYEEVYVTLRSLLWGRLGEKGVNAVFQELVNQHGNYQTSLGGVQINCTMQFSGYMPWGEDMLLATTGQTKHCFVQLTVKMD